jgi:hypothetical protein
MIDQRPTASRAAGRYRFKKAIGRIGGIGSIRKIGNWEDMENFIEDGLQLIILLATFVAEISSAS